MEKIEKLLMAASYLAGVGFVLRIIAVVGYLARHGVPPEVPVGAPGALTAVAAAVTFLPGASRR